MNYIGKILILYIIAIIFSIAYVTPIMGMTKVEDIETDTTNNNEKYEDPFTLYAGVEKVFDIDIDKNNWNTEEEKQVNKVSEVHFVPNNNGFKSYMSYKAITNKNSKQYELQQKAYTGKYGIRMVDNRYCVVLGSFFQKEIGTYFDLVLENGTIIKCILSDVKSSTYTMEDNITSLNGCILEFIIDSDYLVEAAKTSGDISNCNDRWKSGFSFCIIWNKYER